MSLTCIYTLLFLKTIERLTTFRIVSMIKRTIIEHYAFHALSSAIILLMEAKISAKLTLFLVTFNRSLTENKLTFDSYFLQNKPAQPKALSRFEFLKLVEKYAKAGSPFAAMNLFQELSKDEETVELQLLKEALAKVSRLLGPKGSETSKEKEQQYARKLQEDKQKERLLKVAIDRLQVYIASGSDPDKIFNDCDSDGSGDIDKQEFNKFLVASEVSEFTDKDIRRLLIDSLFTKYGKQRISKTDFFAEFKLVPKKTPVKEEPKKIIDPKKPNNNPQEKGQEKEKGFRIKEDIGKPKPPPVPAQNQEEELVVTDHRRYFESYKKDFPLASKYYRLGVPSSDEIPYVEELERLLASGKIYTDPKNPLANINAKGSCYTQASTVFNGQKYELFSKSPSVMNRERDRLGIGQLIETKDIMQGGVGDCFFLGTLGSVTSKYPELISEMFLFDLNPAKYIAVRLFIDGQWKILKTDEQFPAINNNQFVYTQSHQRQLWVMLIQKCYAKAYGHYEAIDGGSQMEAIELLTGANSESLNMVDEKNKQVIKKRLLEAQDKGYVIMSSGDKKMTDASKIYETKNNGLVAGHSYSLLGLYNADKQTLVKLRNPWGNFVWRGDWSYNSKLWTPELRKQFCLESDPQDGSFYMKWSDYVNYYNNIIIGSTNPTFVHTSLRMINNVRKSSYVIMKVNTPGTYHIISYQESHKKFLSMKPKYQYSNSRMIIMRKPANGPMQFVAAKTNYWKTNSIEAQLQKGTYIVSVKIKWKKWKDHETFLTVYGPDRVNMEKIVKRETIVEKFKHDMAVSFAKLESRKGSWYVIDYEWCNVPNVLLITYATYEEGIGFSKLVNNSSKTVKVEISYKFQGSKPIRPATDPYYFEVPKNSEQVIGIMMTSGNRNYDINAKFIQ